MKYGTTQTRAQGSNRGLFTSNLKMFIPRMHSFLQIRPQPFPVRSPLFRFLLRERSNGGLGRLASLPPLELLRPGHCF